MDSANSDAVRLHVEFGGSIGIGTTSPAAKLEIKDTAVGLVVLHVKGWPYVFGDYISVAEFSNDSDAYSSCPKTGIGFEVKYKSDGTLAGLGSIYVGKANDTDENLDGYMAFTVRSDSGGTAERVRINKDGAVGINHTNPGSKLVVKGSGNTSATSSLNVTDSSDNSKLFVRDDGNIGAGSTQPANNLSVAGNASIGSGYATIPAPTNGLIVEGKVGLGVGSAPILSSLDFAPTLGNKILLYPYAIDNSFGLGLQAGLFQIFAGYAADIAFGIGASDYFVELVRIKGTGEVGVGTTSPAKKMEIVDGSDAAQLRLSYDPGNKFADLLVDTNHDLTIKPSSTGQVILQPTDNSTDFFQVKDKDGNAVLNVDATNKRVGVGETNPSSKLEVLENSGGTGQKIVFSGKTDATTKLPAIQLSDGTNTRSVLGLRTGDIAVGNAGAVGIGETSPANKLSVAGSASVGSGYSTTAAPTDGMIIQGATGIGTTSPTSGIKLDVNGKLRATDQARFASGAVGTPSISFDGDTNTGIFQPRADTMALTTNGSERLRILENGAIGIGTSEPHVRFHSTGSTIVGVDYIQCPPENMGNGQLNFWVDETNHKLKFKVKYSDGTVKNGEVSLS